MSIVIGYLQRSMLAVCGLSVMVYLIVAAIEDGRNMEVTRGKHLIGFIPAVAAWILFARERNIYDIGIIILFIGGWLLCGRIEIYGMADGFVFGNLTLLFGGMEGAAGIGLVILIIILACFSGMVEIFLRKMVTAATFKQNKHIAFVPHILTGYVVVMVVLFACL